MIRYLIDADSSIFSMIDAASLVNRRIAQCEAGEIAISAISFAEIALGSQIGKPPRANMRNCRSNVPVSIAC